MTQGKLCTCYSLKASYDFTLIKQWGDKPQWNCSNVQLVFELLKMTTLCKNGCNSWRVQSFILTLKDFKNISLVLCDIKMINHKCIHRILQVHHHTFDWLTHSAAQHLITDIIVVSLMVMGFFSWVDSVNLTCMCGVASSPWKGIENFTQRCPSWPAGSCLHANHCTAVYHIDVNAMSPLCH